MDQEPFTKAFRFTKFACLLRFHKFCVVIQVADLPHPKQEGCE